MIIGFNELVSNSTAAINLKQPTLKLAIKTKKKVYAVDLHS
jgi:hypothetical protein